MKIYIFFFITIHFFSSRSRSISLTSQIRFISPSSLSLLSRFNFVLYIKLSFPELFLSSQSPSISLISLYSLNLILSFSRLLISLSLYHLSLVSISFYIFRRFLSAALFRRLAFLFLAPLFLTLVLVLSFALCSRCKCSLLNDKKSL